MYNHQRQHTGQIDVCDKCGKNFKNRAPYLEHINYGHTNVPTIQCVYCGEMYWMPTQCDNHLRAKHTKASKAPKRKASSTVSKPPTDDEQEQPSESVDNAPEAPIAEYDEDTNKYSFRMSEDELPLVE